MTRNQDLAALRIGPVQYEIGILAAIRPEAPVVKEPGAQSLAGRRRQEPGRYDLVRINIRFGQDQGTRTDFSDGFQGSTPNDGYR